MKLTEIIENTELTDSQVVEATIEAVKTARATYGNTEVDVDTQYVQVADGEVGVQFLSPSDKAILAKRALRDVIRSAVEQVQEHPLLRLDNLIQEGLATDELLCSLNQTTDSRYL